MASHFADLLRGARASRGVILAVLAATAFLQVWRFQPLVRPVGADDQIYYFVSERVASGVAPHVSLVDHKHQLPALLSGAAIAVGRSFGIDDVIAARVVSTAMVMLLVTGTFELASVLTGSIVAGLLAAVVALGFRTVFLEASMGFRPQLFMMTFAVVGLLAFARQRIVPAAVAAACSFLCWQPAALVGGGMFVALLPSLRRGPKAIVSLIAGGFGTLLVYETYFLAKGAIGEQLRQSYRMAFSPAGVRPPAALATLRFLVPRSSGSFSLDDCLTTAMLAGLLAIPVFVVLKPRRAFALWSEHPAWVAVALAAAGAVAFTFLDHQAYPDKFFYLPYVALMAAALPAAAGALFPRLRWEEAGAVLAAAALAMIVFRPDSGRGLRSSLDTQRASARGLARLARSEGGGLWVIGRPELLAFNRMANWTPFGMLLDRRVLEYARQQTGEPFYRPLRNGRMPNVIVTARAKVRRDLPWLRKEYVPYKGKSPFRRERLGIFVRKERFRTHAPRVRSGRARP